jgi:4-amino-4-deoxy-L-arabinose transferase-like glycosyltransferase
MSFSKRRVQDTPAQMPIYLTLMLAVIAFFVCGLWNLQGPGLWWDEGWTLSVARTIVERGAYARLSGGELAASGLEAAIPVTQLVAFSFMIFGVGSWQGRLPGIVAGTIALLLLFFTARRLYNQPIAWGAVFTTVFLAGHPHLNTLTMARQVLGELPMLAALLGALLCVDRAAKENYLWVIPAGLLGVVAMSIKAQAQPFWLVGLGTGIAVAYLLKEYRYLLVIAIILLTNLFLRSPFQAMLHWLVNPPIPPTKLPDLLAITALVIDPSNRMFNLMVVAMFGMPIVLGMAVAVQELFRTKQQQSSNRELVVFRALLIGIIGSWMIWFLALSVGIIRYFFPVCFLGSIFSSALFYSLTTGFNLRLTIQRLASSISLHPNWRSSGAAWLATLLALLGLSLSGITLSQYYLFGSDPSAYQVRDYLNQMPPGTHIETYESELHFLLNQPYSYPPDEVHVNLNRRVFFGQEVAIPYDPLWADPDYIVVGPFAGTNGLYQAVIKSNGVLLVKRFGGYTIYERLR